MCVETLLLQHRNNNVTIMFLGTLVGFCLRDGLRLCSVSGKGSCQLSLIIREYL